MTKVKGVTACRVPDTPTNTPTKTDTPTNTPTDTISRAAALSIIYEIDTFQAGWRTNAMDQIKALPSAQPDLSEYSDKLWRNAYERGKAEAQAEIIRCKDCKWSDISAMGHLAVCNHARGLIDASPNSYCNFAERRTDGVDS